MKIGGGEGVQGERGEVCVVKCGFECLFGWECEAGGVITRKEAMMAF